MLLWCPMLLWWSMSWWWSMLLWLSTRQKLESAETPGVEEWTQQQDVSQWWPMFLLCCQGLFLTRTLVHAASIDPSHLLRAASTASGFLD
jgi:hypothetical protein